jgi:hypothetical protein
MLKHMYGVSESHYASTDTEPLFGTGQGSDASPAIWIGVVVILFNALDRISTEDDIPGLFLSDPWNDFSEKWRVGAFVDNTNQGAMDPNGSLTVSKLADQFQQSSCSTSPASSTQLTL